MLEKVIVVPVGYEKPLVLNQLSDAYRCRVSAAEVGAVLYEDVLEVDLAESLHRVEV